MSVAFLHGGETLRGCLLVIQNDIGVRNPPEGVDAEIRTRWSSSSDDRQMRQLVESGSGGYQIITIGIRHSYWRSRGPIRVAYCIPGQRAGLAGSADLYNTLSHHSYNWLLTIEIHRTESPICQPEGTKNTKFSSDILIGGVGYP